MSSDPIADAVNVLESDATYQDVGLASIPDTVEALILAKPALRVLRTQPRLSIQLLAARLNERPARSLGFPRIGLIVAIGDLGRAEALPVLAAYLASLPDEAIAQATHIDHPFRYVLRSIERLSGESLGLGPLEDLGRLFAERHAIARRFSDGTMPDSRTR